MKLTRSELDTLAGILTDYRMADKPGTAMGEAIAEIETFLAHRESTPANPWELCHHDILRKGCEVCAPASEALREEDVCCQNGNFGELHDCAKQPGASEPGGDIVARVEAQNTVPKESYDRTATWLGEKVIEVGSLRAQNKALLEALAIFGRHASNCARYQTAYKDDCTCGFHAAIAQAKEQI